jgi:anti-sigma-K factor RskA
MKENPDMDTNASNERIDELLNSYIDDELTIERQAEVERLIDQDAKIAQRLKQLQKCQILVGSMPYADAPASVLEGVRASLAGSSLPSEEQPAYEQQAGKKYVLLRKVLAAAAMIGLAAVLSVVIHRIVPLQNVPEGPVAVENRTAESIKPVARIVAASGFSGRLELKTSALNAVDAFIKSAIDDNGLSASISPERRQSRRIYSLDCTREGLHSLLDDLDNIWPELDSATLFVNTEVFGTQTVIDAVTTKQIAEIAGQDNPERRIELAKDFAVLNNIAENLPDKEIRAAIESGDSSLTQQWRILKPVLTGNQKAVKKPAGQAKEKQTVHLTIILDW